MQINMKLVDMDLKTLSLKDKELFREMTNLSGATGYFNSFANLYFWKDAEDIRYFFHDGNLIVMGDDSETLRRYFLFADPFKATRKNLEYLAGKFKYNGTIEGLSRKQKEYLESIGSDLYDFTHRREKDNYIYLTQELIELEGKRFHSKKNHLNSFLQSYDYTYHRYTKDIRNELLTFLGSWYLSRPGEKTLLDEANAIVNTIDSCDELGLKGGLLRVEGRIVAFSLGEQLTENMAVIHYEKADTDYRGAYVAINNEFLKNEWKNLKYVNREEDMGIEGLRKAKLSYRPDILFEIYSATPKK